MTYFGLTTGPLIILAIYAVIVFTVSFYRPKWGLYCLIPIIGLGVWQATVLKGGFLIIVAIGSAFHLLVTRKKITVTREVWMVASGIFLFVAWVIIRSFFGWEGFSFWAFWVMKRLFATMVLAGLVVTFIKTKKDAWEFAWVMVGFAVVTALVGILQYMPGSQIFWTLREIWGLPPDVAYQITGKIRITGISTFVIPLSYQLLSLFPIALAWCLAKTKNTRENILAFASVAIIFIGLVLTFIKAGIGGAVIGGGVTLSLLWRARLIKPWMSKATLASGLVCLALVFIIPALRANVFRLGDTSYERIPITIAATKIIRAYPLGVGYTYYAKADEVYSEVSEYQGSRMVLSQFPHSIVFGIAAILGIPALLFVMLFYVLLFKGLWRVAAQRTKNVFHDPLLRILAIGLIGSFVAYLVNAMFHNNNPFFGDTFNWLLIGLALAVINIYRSVAD